MRNESIQYKEHRVQTDLRVNKSVSRGRSTELEHALNQDKQ